MLTQHELRDWEDKLMSLRDLRKWHMQQVYSFRKRAQDRRASHYSARLHNLHADFHLKAVQALNSCFPATDNDHLE